VSASSDAVTSSIFVNLSGVANPVTTIAPSPSPPGRPTRVGTLCQPKGALHLHCGCGREVSPLEAAGQTEEVAGSRRSTLID